MIKALEKHQNKKCLECPYHWSDGMFSECGCYIEEGKLGERWQKLNEILRSDEYSGCFIPLFIIKIVCKFEVWQYKRYTKKRTIWGVKEND